jgi:methyl-accepting chemotaxis protein
MKLATKMAMGFGSLVVIAAILGAVCWQGLGAINTNLGLLAQGAGALAKMNSCATLRRDFGAQGFQKAEGETQNAAEKWLDAHGQLVTALKDLEQMRGLGTEHLDLVHKTGEHAEAYKASFQKMAEARKTRDKATDDWRTIGGKITTDIEKAVEEIVAPALQKARSEKKFEELDSWSTIADSLDGNVVQTFLLMRVCGGGLIASGSEKDWTALSGQIAALKDGLAKWSSLVKGNAQLETLAKTLGEYVQQYEVAATTYHNGLLAEQAAVREAVPAAQKVRQTTEALNAKFNEDMKSVAAQTRTLATIMGIGSVLAGVLLAVFITRSIVGAIRRIIAGLTDGSHQVNAAASQVAAASQQLAEGASEQASSLEETSSALEEMAAMTRTNAGNAKQANELASQARQAADEGDRTMVKLNDAMTGINESSGKISKIIKVIEEIAFQTNLLALNAAVEAARAGEHGKGFAVVADEVRNLAQRSAQAAKETTSLIEDAVNRSREGTQVAGDVGKALSAIVGDVSKVSGLIDAIAKASDEQAQGVEQVNTAVSQMDKVTQQNASGAEESASAAEELSAQAQTLDGMVGELIAMVEGCRKEGTQAASRSQSTKAGHKTAAQKPAASKSTGSAKAGKPAEEEFLPVGDNSDLKSF